MKNIIYLIAVMLVVAVLAGCTSSNIDLPKVGEDESVVYVTHLKENSITAINTTTGSQEKVDLPYTFSSVVEIDSGIYLASAKEEASLFEINTKKHTISPRMDIAQGVIELLYDEEEGLLYAANGRTDKVQVINIEKKKVFKELEVGKYPSKMAQSGKELFVLAAGSGEVYVLNTSLQEVTRSFPVNPRPEGLYHDGSNLWTGGHGATGELNERVFAYDPNSGTEIAAVKTGLMPIVILQAQENAPLYVLSHGDHSLSVIDAQTFEVNEKMNVGDNPSYMMEDEGNLYITSLDGDELLIIDRDSFQVKKTYDIPSGPFIVFKGGGGE